MCYEERVLYRLFSGMHTATNLHISWRFFPPRKGVRDEWAPNPARFHAQYVAAAAAAQGGWRGGGGQGGGCCLVWRTMCGGTGTGVPPSPSLPR